MNPKPMNPTIEVMQPALFEESPAIALPKKTRRTAAQAIEEFGLKAPSKHGKNYVLDTNVLLHDPACLERFKENHLCILVDVLAELDKFKSEQTERGANARRVHRRLTDIFGNSEMVTRGVPTEGGGTIATPSDWRAHPGTVGRAWPTAEIAIFDDEGHRLGPGEVGTVYIKMTVLRELV
jgi:hypothetical protein